MKIPLGAPFFKRNSPAHQHPVGATILFDSTVVFFDLKCLRDITVRDVLKHRQTVLETEDPVLEKQRIMLNINAYKVKMRYKDAPDTEKLRTELKTIYSEYRNKRKRIFDGRADSAYLNELELSLDDSITEELVGHWTRKKIRSHKPLAVEELTRRIRTSVHHLKPVQVFLLWAGNKETEYHTADYFDYHVAYFLPENMSFGESGRLYPFDLNIIFCDNHAIEANKIHPEIVKKYETSLRRLLSNTDAGKQYDRIINMSEIIREYETSNASSYSAADQKLELMKMARTHCLPFRKTSNMDFKSLALQLEARLQEGDPDLVKLQKIWMALCKEDFMSKRIPKVEEMKKMKKNGTLKSEEVWNNPSARNLFTEQAAKHAGSSDSDESGKTYVSTRNLDFLVLSEQFPTAIYVSFSAPERDVFFSKLPTLYMCSYKSKTTNQKITHGPWSMNAWGADVRLLNEIESGIGYRQYIDQAANESRRTGSRLMKE